jgi:hypothetical protein
MTNDYILAALAADRQNTLRAQAHSARQARRARPSATAAARLRVRPGWRSDRRARHAARGRRAVASQ